MSVRTDLTESHFRGFVRRDEPWPEDSPQYQAGCSIENRKRPPPPEVPGDAFDRQRVIPDFDQGLIERQVCLVLGAGGIGQDAALTLGRLGVGKIILIDYDTYDPSNLTRQCLGSKADVGLRKVDVAARSLREHHALRAEVVAVDCDAMQHWSRIVDLAREATVVFNGIDAGVMWDFCVNSLCKELGLPLVCGQSFGWKFMVEMYTGEPGEVCAFCHDSTLSVFQASEQAITRRFGVEERLVAFLAERGAESIEEVSPDMLGSFLHTDTQFRCCETPVRDELVARALAHTGLQALRRASLAADLLRFLVAFHQEVTSRLLPGKISAVTDISFVPRPKQMDTRYVGSWVCPCLGCAVMMVSQWAGWLTAPLALNDSQEADGLTSARRNLPQAVTFNLDAGMTGDEQLGYELGPLGMPLDKAERRFCRETCNAKCQVCRGAARLRAEKSLFIGRLPVHLAPVCGNVEHLPGAWREPWSRSEQPESWAAAADASLARRQPLASLGSEYSNVVVPALPALDWEPVTGSGIAQEVLPPELAVVPLLKVPSSSSQARSPSALAGVASGVRSALVPARGRWWRLKGCGNNDEGFPVKAVGDHGELNVRGCCFGHTANTELRMSSLAADALAAAGLDAANRPAGSWRYKAEVDWPLPSIERQCAVFETVGNARLGDHLLSGLLQLLEHIVPEPPGYGFAGLRGALAAGRQTGPEDLWPTETVVSCEMATADVGGELAAMGLQLEETPPAVQCTTLPDDLVEVWEAAREQLAAKLCAAKTASGEPSLLLWLAWRLGWECGATVRALHAADIAWGTYPDSMGIHCNAHTNNLVVKPSDVGSGTTFLAALDFDMAFTRSNYLPGVAQTHAGLGLDTWEGVMNFEAKMGMKTVLSGSDFSSTGVENMAKVPPSHAAVELAVWDTLVTAYDAAFSGSEDKHPHHPEMREAAYDLVRLALCLTTHVQG